MKRVIKTETLVIGSYAVMGKLTGLPCTIGSASNCKAGVVLGAFLSPTGSPRCVVLTRDGSLQSVNLSEIRISDAASRVPPLHPSDGVKTSYSTIRFGRAEDLPDPPPVKLRAARGRKENRGR